MTERHAEKRLVYFFVLLIAMLLVTTTAFAVDYSVPINSYDSFRNAVMDNGYDIDDAHGVQCFDGVGLLWRQLGRWLDSGGTGAAKGTWSVEYARIANAGSEFELITRKEDVKRGDVVVLDGPYTEGLWSISESGHIGFADEDYDSSKKQTDVSGSELQQQGLLFSP